MRSKPTRQARVGSSRTNIASSPISLTSSTTAGTDQIPYVLFKAAEHRGHILIEVERNTSVEPTRSAKHTVHVEPTADCSSSVDHI